MRIDRLGEVGMVVLAGVLLAALVAVSAVTLSAPAGAFDLELSENGQAGQVLHAGSLSGMTSAASTEAYEFGAGDIGFTATFFWENPAANPVPGTLRIELHRVDGLLDVPVDAQFLSDNGYVAAYWQNLDAGKYYVKLVRTNGSESVEAANVMFYQVEHV